MRDWAWTRWSRSEWLLFAVALAVASAGAEPWTATVWTVRSGSGAPSELRLTMPGWSGGYRAAVLLLALAGVAAVLLARGRGTGMRHLRAASAAVLAGCAVAVALSPLVDPRIGVPAAAGTTVRVVPLVGCYLAAALLATAALLAVRTGRDSRAIHSRPAGATASRRGGTVAARVILASPAVLLALSLLPWYSTRSVSGRLGALSARTVSANAWQASSAWTLGVCLGVFAVVLAAVRHNTGSRATTAVVLLAGAVVIMFWPFYRMLVPSAPEPARVGGTAIVAAPPSFPGTPTVHRNELTVKRGGDSRSGPEPAAFIGSALVGAQGAAVLVMRRRPASAVTPSGSPSEDH